MTETITLHTAFANYPHVQALKDGSVPSDRVSLRLRGRAGDHARLPAHGANAGFRSVRDRADDAGSGACVRQADQGAADRGDARVSPWRAGVSGRVRDQRAGGSARQEDRRAGVVADHRASGCAAFCWTNTAWITATSPG